MSASVKIKKNTGKQTKCSHREAKAVNFIIESGSEHGSLAPPPPKKKKTGQKGSYCCCSVAQSCPTLCDPMDCSTPGFPVFHCLLEFAQTHVHQVDDAIQPSHPLSSPSPPALNLSQHQGFFQMSHLFASGGQSTGVSASASVLPMNIQD